MKESKDANGKLIVGDAEERGVVVDLLTDVHQSNLHDLVDQELLRTE